MMRIWSLGLIGLILLFPSYAHAHPLDQLLQITYITVAPNRINLVVELYPGILVAPQLITMIDTNQDDNFSEAERLA